jgi:hypothetical protein
VNSLNDLPALRRCVLAVSVLDDIDVVPHHDGFVLGGPDGSLVGWEQAARIIGGHDADSPVARRRLADWLGLRLVVLSDPDAVARLRSAARLLALPADHAAHPGPGWEREPVRGGVLRLGIGVVGLVRAPDVVVPLPPDILDNPHVVNPWWLQLRDHAERMGALAAARLTRDGGSSGVLRPVGGVDALTLLASRAVRRHLAETDSAGMRAVAAPVRTRAWFDLARIDPAFVGAAWVATDEWDRGLPRPLLVTVDEVAIPRAGGDPVTGVFDPPRNPRH